MYDSPNSPRDVAQGHRYLPTADPAIPGDTPEDRSKQTLHHGARAARAGECDALYMECFSKQEVDELKAWMARVYPDVTVYWSYLEGAKKPNRTFLQWITDDMNDRPHWHGEVLKAGLVLVFAASVASVIAILDLIAAAFR